jgi:hypothetical protein
MKYKFLFLSLFLMLLLGAFQQIFACSCVRNISTCQRLGYSDVIFIGKVVDVKTESGDASAIESTVFEVEEMFLGAKKEQIIVRNKSGTSCDTEFATGETYVVFANGDEKKGFGTGYCSGNTLISDAAEILDDLRGLPKAGAGGKIYGHVSENLKKRAGESVPMAGVKIKFQELGGKSKIYNAVTDEKGNYELIVPQGKYKIIPTVPAYAALGFIGEEPIFAKDRACVEESFSIENKSRISGRVVDADGKPVPDINLELIPIDQIEKPDPYDDGSGYLLVEDDGTFTIDHIPAGKYTLSVNYTFFPNEESPFPTVFYPNSPERAGAKVFEIGLGKSIGGIVFRLPPRLSEKTIRGTITFEDGKPAANVDVYLEDAENYGFCVNGCDTKTDAEGNFTLKGYLARKYIIKSFPEIEKDGETKKYALDSPTISLYDNVNELKLVLKETKEEK